MLHAPPRYPIFPYTTLFRSQRTANSGDPRSAAHRSSRTGRRPAADGQRSRSPTAVGGRPCSQPLSVTTMTGHRSEEHTSELQSRENLVCRLLLEKKKNKVCK